jgi:HAD superfamily hydrolase (TIGR01509 family)
VPKPYDLVVFDCDGVLVDSERLAVRIEARALTALGWVIDEHEVIERFVGRSHADMTRDIVAYLGRELPDNWDAELDVLYRATFEAELEPVPGIAAALGHITTPTCVASSSGHDHLRFALGHTGLLDNFDGRIFSASEVEHGKPAPDLFLHAARRMGADPARCAVVEDSAPGVAAAVAAGMDAYAFAGGVTPAAKLAGPGVTVFTDMAELPHLLGD